MKVERVKYITREEVQANPHKIYVFGDNLERKGLGGQAGQMRGEPNAVGIATKKRPDNSIYSFFRDSEYDKNVKWISGDFVELGKKVGLLEGELGIEITVVIPEDGLGTGLARLDTVAPKTFDYLQNRLSEIGNG